MNDSDGYSESETDGEGDDSSELTQQFPSVTSLTYKPAETSLNLTEKALEDEEMNRRLESIIEERASHISELLTAALTGEVNLGLEGF